MSRNLLYVLDFFFVVFHTAWILFSLFGWISRRTRRANLVVLLLTAASWLGLGLFFGLGYCPLTDWHWQVLRALGQRELPRSYTQYLLIRLLGIRLDATTVDVLTAASATAALVVSVWLNIRTPRRPPRTA